MDNTSNIVIAISTRALFDLKKENKIYEEQGIEEYEKHEPKLGNKFNNMEEQKEYGINVNRSSEHLGDCLELMQYIPDGSIDMILCDLPYGTTSNKWDAVIAFEPLWELYW